MVAGDGGRVPRNRRPDPAKVVGRTLPTRWPDPRRTRKPVRNNEPASRDETHQGARSRPPGRHPSSGTGEVALSQSHPDPPHARPVGHQIRRAVGRRTQCAQERAGERNGKGLRDLHPHHPRTVVGSNHHSGGPIEVQFRRRRVQRLERGLEYVDAIRRHRSRRRRNHRNRPADAASSTRCAPCGETTSRRKASPASRGRSNRCRTHAC